MSQGQEVVLLWDADWQQPSVPRWLCTAPGHPSCRGSESHHIPGVGGGPLDAFPGLPLLRQQSLFSAFSPSAAKGCPGRLAGSGARADRVQHPHVVSKMLGQGYEGRSWQSRTTDNSSFRSLPYFKVVMAGLHVHDLCLSSLSEQTFRHRTRKRGNRGSWPQASVSVKWV